MKKIKVRVLFGKHMIYSEIIKYPPKNIIYIGTKKGQYYKGKSIKRIINRLLSIGPLPRMLPIKTSNENLIHSSRGIIPTLITKPWVIDLEYATSFVRVKEEEVTGLKKLITKKFLESKNCKKILPHCKGSVDSIKRNFKSEIINKKIEILYPATHIPRFMIKYKKKKKNNITILFVASLFELKGGLFVLEAFKRLEKKYKNIDLVIKADIPDKIKNKYKSKNIKYFPYKTQILPRETLLRNFYAKADIFLYPTTSDSFGYGLLDAMCCKLPIVTSNNFAIPEIVNNNKGGFIIDMGGGSRYRDIKKLKNKERILKEIVKKVEKLIKNPALRKKMGNYGYKQIKQGKFSIKHRNKQLRRIYEEAIK